jgi:hypothetical protein
MTPYPSREVSLYPDTTARIAVKRGADQTLPGAFADAELAGELRAEASEPGTSGAGLLDQRLGGVQARVVGVGVRHAWAGA